MNTEEEEVVAIARRLRADFENSDTPEFSYDWLAREVYKILVEDRRQRETP